MRSPINSVIGLVELAKNSLNDHEETEKYLKKIKNISNYLLLLSNNILDYSKLEYKAKICHRDFYLKDLIEDVVSLFEVQTAQKNQELIVKRQIDEDHKIIGDSLLIKQVLINLLSNAVKYTPKCGTIIFETNSTFNNGKTNVEFVVTDNGIGMSEEFLETLYDPYVQENEDQNQEQKGTGLGMMIVKKIIKAMDGKIDVTSMKNHGTTFKITLGFKSVEPSVLDAYDFSGKRFLLVDDSVINTELISQFLYHTNAIIDIAVDGEEAFQKVKETKENYYDLILMDMRMPKLDGCACTKLIRNLPRNDSKNIKIIALTANCLEEDISKALTCGMNDYLLKPINAKWLYKIIRKNLN